MDKKRPRMLVFVLASGLLLLAGCGAVNTEEPALSGLPAPEPAPSQTEAANETAAIYGLDEIAGHAAKDDCWIAVENEVFDITAYIAASSHPGGSAILEGCGQNATELFNTRPMGSGTPHSERARNALRGYYIGDLKQ